MLLNTVLLIFAAMGHLGIWIIVFNQIHSTGWPRSIRKGSELFIIPIAVLLPVVILVLLLRGSHNFSDEFVFYQNDKYVFGYAILCWLSCIFSIGVWISRKFFFATNPEFRIAHKKKTIDVQRHVDEPLTDHLITRFLVRLPFNDVFKLAVEEKTLHLPQLPPELDGLTISHLSDLHFTGQIKRQFFEYVVEQSNALDCDLTVLTGDILDMAICRDWINEVLSKLDSPLGVYYCLGNHDRRVQPVSDTRERMNNAGLIPVSGRWVTVEHQGSPIHVCGNEMPWFPEARSLPEHPDSRPEEGLRILLSHSPDQAYWARRFGIDFMLAGHTHGGQIRLPVFGSIVSASKYGNAFSAGLFKVRGLLLHVSRGISSTRALRLNCPPELVKIILRRNRD